MPDVGVVLDGQELRVEEGTLLLEAASLVGSSPPTLCHLSTLTPANACRLCVVEVEGEKVLAPACSRQVRDGMVVETDSERVRHARRMILEFLGATVDLAQAPGLDELMTEYGADPARFAGGKRSAPPDMVDNPLFVRVMERCVLCYRCVSACGVDAQWTFAIAVAGRGFDAGISTEFGGSLPDSACVFCGNCVGVCPTNALQFRSEFELRAAGLWQEEEQSVTQTICGYCGVGCPLDLHVQENRIVKVMSPIDSQVTSGNLCVKGRFGHEFVHVDQDTPIDRALRRARA